MSKSLEAIKSQEDNSEGASSDDFQFDATQEKAGDSDTYCSYLQLMLLSSVSSHPFYCFGADNTLLIHSRALLHSVRNLVSCTSAWYIKIMTLEVQKRSVLQTY